ncbi:MAG: hypothetical protein IPM54_42535 [Polyangiaceae bacterium]|nr:hypothetical protein [Polyangiaceae bacterium]
MAAGQMRAIAKAYQRAGYSINTVDLFEGHGTGTALGDKTEITALRSMLEQEDEKRLHWLGSIKGNIGHCKAAAGVAGLMKAVMALRNKIIPPSVACLQPNGAFGRPLGVLRPATHGSAWEKPAGQRRRAGVSAMGFGGANAHITLEEADESTVNEAHLAVIHSAQSHELVCLSADSLPALHKRLRRLHEVARQICRAQLTDLSAAVLSGEQRGRYRIAFVSESPWELSKQVEYALGAMDGSDDIHALDASKRGIFAGITRDEPKIAFLSRARVRSASIWARPSFAVTPLYAIFMNESKATWPTCCLSGCAASCWSIPIPSTTTVGRSWSGASATPAWPSPASLPPRSPT